MSCGWEAVDLGFASPDTYRKLRLIIVHYHLRPGGVRRVIELGTPYLVHGFKRPIQCVTLATGESPDLTWRTLFENRMNPVPVDYFIEPSLHYFSQQPLGPAALRKGIRRALARLFAATAPDDTLVWAHNLGIARNLILTSELTRICQQKSITLAAHHHDWWFDNRWIRWPEIRREGSPTLAAAARAVFPKADRVRHLTINHADTRVLQPHFKAAWVPNLTERAPDPEPARVRKARGWLQQQLNERGAPVWIVPCRLLRRKNIAEALVLARWLRPEAWLVTTGDVSSNEEARYADKLRAATRKHRWRLRLGLLAGGEAKKPTVPELVAASECLLLTSVQEGFGLPYLEAAAARQPLIARTLPNIAPDLHRFGFQFPQSYDEILVAPGLFDWRAEVRRQCVLFERWWRCLPRPCRTLAERPALLEHPHTPRPLAFSRLTLTAQLEVLAHPADLSWAQCRRLNPFLDIWQQRAAARRLRISPWPARAVRWLSGRAFARHWTSAVTAPPGRPPDAVAAAAAQRDFIAEKLQAKYLYPLLWSTES